MSGRESRGAERGRAGKPLEEKSKLTVEKRDGGAELNAEVLRKTDETSDRRTARSRALTELVRVPKASMMNDDFSQAIYYIYKGFGSSALSGAYNKYAM